MSFENDQYTVIKVDQGLKNEVEEVKSSLAEKATQGLTCKELNMSANDSTKGVDNFNKLVAAINQGYKILVDDNYHLETTAISSLDKSVIINGINEKSKFTLKNGNTFFNATANCTSIFIEGVQFSTSGTALTILFSLSGTLYFDNISTRKCSFDGNISLFRYTAPNNLNPTVTKYGFGIFRFEDNSVKNTRYSFIVLVSVPCEAYFIRRNKVQNFDYLFFNAGSDNTHSYPTELKNSQKLMVVENNHVTCDDSWTGSGTSGAYYCFVLFEGLTVKYNMNHVEGIKSDYVIAVYDAYLSAENVEYMGNTWKNNICFNASKLNNTLMKAKGGSGIKRYHNNNFIVEENFATRLGKDPMLLKVNLHDITEASERWEISNNTFDVYYLTFQQSSNQGREIWIENNTFKCMYVQNRVINYRVEAGVDYTKTIHKIRNNVFEIRDTLVETNFFGLIACTDFSSGANKCGRIIIDNNTIKVHDMQWLLYEVLTNTLELKNNTIEILSATPSTAQGFVYNSKINNYKNLNNVAKKPNGRFREGNSEWLGEVLEDYVIQDKGITDAASKIGLKWNNPITVKYRYVRQYEILCTTGLLQFSLTFDYHYDSGTGYNMITFTDDGSVLGNYKLSKSTDIGNGEGHGKLLKLTGTAGSVSMRFTNNEYGNSIYLNNLPDGYKTIKVKTFTAIV